MSTDGSQSDASYLLFIATGLVFYCVSLTVITGDIGFTGDDWWVLAYPYWNSFTDSLVLYSQKFQRPLEGFYWTALFKLFGFNRMAFHLFSLLLLAGSALAMGAALHRVFPGRRPLVSIAVLTAFFLPPLSCLTYVIFTDNSRLSMLLFWISVTAFQRWAWKRASWRGLALPVSLYLVSFLTYETSAFLILIMPFFAWPIHRRIADKGSHREFLIKLCVGTLGSLALAVAVRFLFMGGGAVRNNGILPPFELIWAYLALLPWYLVSPFTSLTQNGWALLIGGLVALSAVAMFMTSRRRSAAPINSARWFDADSPWYPVGIGIGILFLGMLPYQLAGYGSFYPNIMETLLNKYGLSSSGDLAWFNFTWSSRIYSSASFGIAILLAALFNTGRKRSAGMIAKALAVLIVGMSAVFHVGLSQDWQEASEIRNDLIRDLVTQVPSVKSNTNFIFFDLNCSHKRAEVIRKENGLNDLIRMLYGDRSLAAWRAYSHMDVIPGRPSRQAMATPSGFITRDGQRQPEPAAPDNMLLFKREGRKLILLDKISQDESLVSSGIQWHGVNQLSSNPGLIETWSDATSPKTPTARNAWGSGLIATFQLTRLKFTLSALKKLKYMSARDMFPRRLFKVHYNSAIPHF